MIKGLRGASIWSENVNNLLPFYRDLLGLKVAVQTEGFVVRGELGGATRASSSSRSRRTTIPSAWRP